MNVSGILEDGARHRAQQAEIRQAQRRFGRPHRRGMFGGAEGSQKGGAGLITSGLALDLDSRFGVTTAAGTVSAWQDLNAYSAGNGSTFSATGTAQPAFVASDANFLGLPSLTFNGSTTVLNDSTFASASKLTMYCVFKISTIGTQQILMGASALPQMGSFPSSYWYSYSGTVAATGVATTGVHVMAAALDATGGADSALYVDTTVTPIFSATNTGACGPLTSLQIGARAGPAAPFGGSMVRCLMYSSLHPKSSVSKTLKYLAALYGYSWS